MFQGHDSESSLLCPEFWVLAHRFCTHPTGPRRTEHRGSPRHSVDRCCREALFPVLVVLPGLAAAVLFRSELGSTFPALPPLQLAGTGQGAGRMETGVRSRKPTHAVPFRMDTGRGLKNAPINRFSFPLPAQLNVLAETEPNPPIRRSSPCGRQNLPTGSAIPTDS